MMVLGCDILYGKQNTVLYMGYVGTVYEKNSECGMMCWRYGTEKTSMWYGMLAVWYGTMVQRRGWIIW